MVGVISGDMRSLDNHSYETITWKGKYRSTWIPIMCRTRFWGCVLEADFADVPIQNHKIVEPAIID